MVSLDPVKDAESWIPPEPVASMHSMTLTGDVFGTTMVALLEVFPFGPHPPRLFHLTHLLSSFTNRLLQVSSHLGA